MWIRLNAVLGSLVLTLGFWLFWGDVPVGGAVTFGLSIAGFLLWMNNTVGAVWAWATLGLGVESLVWPIVTMARVGLMGDQPTDEQMGLILTAVLFGLFSAIFWMTFAYGLFKLVRKNTDESASPRKLTGSSRE